MHRVEVNKNIEKILENLVIEEKNEFVVLAIAEKKDDKLNINKIYKVLNEGQTDIKAVIDPLDQMKIMKYCEINKMLPVVIHSHLYQMKEASFSKTDIEFEKAFHNVQKKAGFVVNSIFIVYGRSNAEIRITLSGKLQESNFNDTINYKKIKRKKRVECK